MYYSNGDFAVIPISDILGTLDFTHFESLLYAFKVVLEPICHKYGFAVCGFDEIFEGVELVVGRSTDNVKPHGADKLETVWSTHLEVLSQERFYRIGNGLRSDYYGTEDEAKAAKQKRVERFVARHDGPGSVDVTEKALEIAKAVISREFGVKRPTASRIKVARRRGKYTVAYGSKAYTLH